jgi:hypothetical protein
MATARAGRRDIREARRTGIENNIARAAICATSLFASGAIHDE